MYYSPSVVGEAPISLSGGGIDSPAKSAFNPYDTTSLHIFLCETFPGAVLLEEHQVGVLNETIHCPLIFIQHAGCYNVSTSNR